MKTSFKTAIFLALLFFASINLGAQTKIDLAVVEINPTGRTMEISISGKPFQKVDLDKNAIKSTGDVSPAIAEVVKMTSEGWELFNTTTTAGGSSLNRIYTFYLRKKSL